MACEGDSPTWGCIYRSMLCDGTDNCGNNWDEDPAVCSESTHLNHTAHINFTKFVIAAQL